MPRGRESVEGLAELRRGLKSLGTGVERELQKTNKSLVNTIADDARGRASSMGGVQAKAAAAIKGYATGTSMAVGVAAGGRYPMANAAFWGEKAHSGWYAAARYQTSSGQQHPEWVGNSWSAGVAGQGPYAINDAIAAGADLAVDEWGNAIDGLILRSFPGVL